MGSKHNPSTEIPGYYRHYNVFPSDYIHNPALNLLVSTTVSDPDVLDSDISHLDIASELEEDVSEDVGSLHPDQEIAMHTIR